MAEIKMEEMKNIWSGIKKTIFNAIKNSNGVSGPRRYRASWTRRPYTTIEIIIL